LNTSGKISKIWDAALSNSIYFLAVSLVLFIAVPPFLKNENAFRYSILILTSIIVAFVILVLPSNNKFTSSSRWLLAMVLFLPWFMDQSLELDVIILLVFALIYSLTSWRLIKIILVEKTIDMKVIVGSVVGYLMIGFSWTFICALLVIIYPDSFSAPAQMDSPYSFIYYTFVTLSTLGYGDVVPATPQSQAISLLIAISGQFYMVVIVAAIVGKYINSKNPR
jgi:voltage-gated potassium channel